MNRSYDDVRRDLARHQSPAAGTGCSPRGWFTGAHFPSGVRERGGMLCKALWRRVSYRFPCNDNTVKVYVTVNVLDVRGRLDLSWGVSHPRFSPSSFSI
eukprot:scaffold4240_cov120-Isochrysis_galbana.AAC.6